MNTVFETMLIVMEASAALVEGLNDVLFTTLNLGVFGSYSLFSLLFNPANLFLFMTAVMVKKLV
jgi:hypothetical protein